MTTDIAQLGIEIQSKGVTQAATEMDKATVSGARLEQEALKLSQAFQFLEQSTNRLQMQTAQAANQMGAFNTLLNKSAQVTNDHSRNLNQASGATNGLSSATQALGTTVGWVVGLYAAWSLGKHILEVANAGARYVTLGVVLERAGANVGYTKREMHELEGQVVKTGISMTESRETIARMAASHMDLAKATDLARMAQNVAVVANINSSDAFARLIQGIQSGHSIILRTMGIFVDFGKAEERYAASLGKTKDQLSEFDKHQVRTNESLRAGKEYAGIYEEAMTTAGKQITSFTRYVQDFKVKMGSAFEPATARLVMQAAEAMKKLQDEAVRPEAQRALLGLADAVVNLGVAVTGTAVPAFQGFITLLTKTLELWAKLPDWSKGALVGAAAGARLPGGWVTTGLGAIGGAVAGGTDSGKSALGLGDPQVEADRRVVQARQNLEEYGKRRAQAYADLQGKPLELVTQKQLDLLAQATLEYDGQVKMLRDLEEQALKVRRALDPAANVKPARHAMPDRDEELDKAEALAKKREVEEAMRMVTISTERRQAGEHALGRARETYGQMTNPAEENAVLKMFNQLKRAQEEMARGDVGVPKELQAMFRTLSAPVGKDGLTEAFKEFYLASPDATKKLEALNAELVRMKDDLQAAVDTDIGSVFGSQLDAVVKKYNAEMKRIQAERNKTFDPRGQAILAEEAEAARRTREVREGTIARNQARGVDTSWNTAGAAAAGAASTAAGQRRDFTAEAAFSAQQLSFTMRQEELKLEYQIADAKRRVTEEAQRGDMTAAQELEYNNDVKMIGVYEKHLEILKAINVEKMKQAQGERTWQKGAADALAAYQKDAMNMEKNVSSVITNTFKGMEDALVEFSTKGKLSFTDLANSIIADMARMSIRQNITGPLAGIFGDLLKSWSPVGSTTTSSMTYSANGNAFGASGLLALASGGVVSGATVFQHAGGFGVMGENGEEGVLPLQRDSQGRLGVINAAAGATASAPQIQVNIINSSGTPMKSAAATTPKFDAGKWVVDVMVDATVRNVGGFRDVVTAR